MSFTLFLILIGVLLLVFYLYSLQLYWKRKKVPSLAIFSVLASLKLVSLQMSIGDFLWSVYDKFEARLIGLHICGTPSILIKDTRLIKSVLVKDFENFNHRTVGTNYKGDPIGTRVLFSLRNPAWRLMRKKFSPSFTTDKLRAIFPALNAVGDNLVRYLKVREGKPLETKETFHKFSTDIITYGAFGINVNCFENDKAISRIVARKIFDLNFWRSLQFMSYFLLPGIAKIFNMEFIDRSACNFVQNMIADIKQFRNKNNVYKSDFIQTIFELDKENVFCNDRQEIFAQGVQFWVAGFETIGSSLMFLMHELAHHPNIQDRLRDEICTILKENDNKISYNTIRNMTYLNMVAAETFRKYPVLPFLDRMCINDYQIPDTDITIDAGTNVYISIQGLHYDPKYFPDPYKFDPERFDPDKKKSENFPFLSFGEGPRHCIGLRFGKVGVLMGAIKVISKFKIIPVDEYTDRMVFDRMFLLNPKKLIYLKFESLNSGHAGD